ncbi:MAG: GNAT family N-acetyltransferase [Acidimicrobiales bacterium]|nr:GNAT family N-acetyltransferase [Acidimicrobiales bacterium]
MRGSGGGPAAGGPGGDPSVVRVGGPADAASAATLHTRLISDGFLSSLGPRFLGRLYGRIVRSDESFLLIAEAGGTAVGFIAGSVATGRLYRSFLRRDGVAAFLSAPLRLVTALPRVLETLRHGRDDGGAGGGELLAVAVDPEWRGRHVGRQLVEGFLRELEDRGVRGAHVVVGADNEAAIAMYRRSGFAPTRTFEMHPGTRSLVMETDVPVRAVPSRRPGS